jgi:SAM-dependent methyltransferase
MNEDFLAHNRRLWDTWTGMHVDSAFYDLKAFKQGANSLREVELAEIGEVRGLDLLHLQCHFGQDTLSWTRLGARVTGLDLSTVAIQTAQALAQELSLPAHFVATDLYQAPEHLTGQFDLVFTSYGTIGWLPDLTRWAQVIRHFLKPGGRFYLVEFHPLLWLFDDDFTRLTYDYFNTGPIVQTSTRSYASGEHEPLAEYTWNHPISEVLGALLKTGLQLEFFHEHPFSPYKIFPDMKEVGKDRYVLAQAPAQLPYLYSLACRG